MIASARTASPQSVMDRSGQTSSSAPRHTSARSTSSNDKPSSPPSPPLPSGRRGGRAEDEEEQELSRQLAAMLRRERSPDLRPRDYLGLLLQRQGSGGSLSLSSSSSSSSSLSSSGIDKTCRTKMVRWMHDVVDYCKLDREVAYVAASHLDRFLSLSLSSSSSSSWTVGGNNAAASAAARNRRTFQLAAVSCLYLAVKTVESRTVLSPAVVSDISEGEYEEEEIVTMEADVLEALGWRVHGPTASEFASHLLALWERGTDCAASVLDVVGRQDLMDLVRYQVELSTLDYKSSLCRPSVVAAAAICNALDCDGRNNGERDSFLRSVTHYAGERGIPLRQVDCIRDRLVKMLKKALNGEQDEAVGGVNGGKLMGSLNKMSAGASEKTKNPKECVTRSVSPVSPVSVSCSMHHSRGVMC